MRSKYGMENRDDWRCGFCCHVRTGTILLGIWHLILHVLALAIIAVVVIHPELVERSQQRTSIESDGVYEYRYEYSFFKDCKWTKNDINVGMAVTFCTFFITVLMVYGAVKGNPRYLMPFFCLQVFDFCIASLTVVGYFSYMPDVRQTIASNQNIPYQKELLKMDTQWLSLIVLLTFIVLMLVKAYFIGVVWSCYKFLIYRNAARGIAAHINDVDSQVNVFLPPPDYETVTKDPKNFPAFTHPSIVTPPPPYTPRDDSI